MLTALSSWA